MLVDLIFYGNNEAESALSDRPQARPGKLPWCETEEDHEAAMADLAAQDSRWSWEEMPSGRHAGNFENFILVTVKTAWLSLRIW